MTTTRKIPLASAVAAALLVTTGVGYATTWTSGGGSACQPQLASGIDITAQGAINTSTSTAQQYICPLTLGTQTSNPRGIASAVLRYVDNSSSDLYACNVYQTFYYGAQFVSGPKYTCSTAGGCTDLTTVFTGNGFLQWNAAELGSSLYNQFVDANFGFLCTVPRNTSVESRVTSYYTGL